MPRNGSGTFQVLNPIQVGQLRSSAAVNEDFTDMGDELTNSLPINGVAAMTGPFLADVGTAPLPSVSFDVDRNTGFRRSGTNESRWVGGANDRAIMDANGKLTLLNGMGVAGAVNLSGMFGPLNLFATGEAVVALGREENDTAEHDLAIYESGSGVGADGVLRLVGGGANNAATMRYYVNSVKAFEWTSALFSIALDARVGAAGTTIRAAGYVDFPEASAPSNPAANVARLYCRDNSGTTDLYYRDSAGLERQLRTTVDRQIFTGAGTWNKPSTGTMALVQVWGGGGSGGATASSGGTEDYGGGGGGGGYNARVMLLAELSAAVSVTVGAGGAASVGFEQVGHVGGASSFGAYVAAGGGAGGNYGGDNGEAPGGGGGGGLGGSAAGATSGVGGSPRGVLGAATWGAAGTANAFGGGGAGTAALGGGTGLYGGGGGGCGGGDFAGTGTASAPSVFGGGGGGGDSTAPAGSASIVYGGAGGAANGAGNATAGTAPGGGGGASLDGTSGAGARGEIRITVW